MLPTQSSDVILPPRLAIVAGSGEYPLLMARAARAAGVAFISAAAFVNETDPALEGIVDHLAWMRVGQLGKLLDFLRASAASHAVMAGQIHPRNLFDLRPDLKALVLLGKLKRRNAESIFGAIAAEITATRVELLPATTFLEQHLAPGGIFAGPSVSRREKADLRYGFEIAKKTSSLDIGQTIVVKGGSILAVEAFEGTNAAIRRGGELGRRGAVMVKVAKPRQDPRFDVPVIGPLTLKTAHESRLRAIGVEAGCTLLLEREKTCSLAQEFRITLYGLSEGDLHD